MRGTGPLLPRLVAHSELRGLETLDWARESCRPARLPGCRSGWVTSCESQVSDLTGPTPNPVHCGLLILQLVAVRCDQSDGQAVSYAAGMARVRAQSSLSAPPNEAEALTASALGDRHVPRAIEAKMMMNSMLCTTATGPRALPARIATQKPTSRASRIRCLRCAKAVLRPGVHWPVRVAPRCASVGMATSPIGDIPPFLLSNEPGKASVSTVSAERAPV
eukprot:scaffold1473_cov375-Prasinococcus_capsulatus_cf.AAC.7